MIYKNTIINIADNSGPKKAKALNIKKKNRLYRGYFSCIYKKKSNIKKNLKKYILNSIILASKKKTFRWIFYTL